MNEQLTRPLPPPPRPASFAHVDTWVFDLDNTLYPFGSPVWPQIDQRITQFFTGTFGLDGLSSRALQKFYYERYGTSLRGLMIEDGINPETFLDYVHDIDRTSLEPNPRLASAIGALPGRRLILTNGSRNHALRTAERLGIDHLFEDMFDIVAAEMIPKPEAVTFQRFFDRHNVDPTRSAMFEDLAKNLEVPHARGMVTVLVTDPGLTAATAASAHVDFVTSDLTGFLETLIG